MTEPTDQDRDEDRLLAAEFALGLLDPDEARAFEARMMAEPALAEEYAVWTEEFARLVALLPDTPPPQGSYPAIERRLFPEEAKSLWQRLGIVQAVLGAAAAALVFILFMQFGGPREVAPDAPVYVAELGLAETGVTVIAALAGEALELTRSGPDAPPDHSYELWLIAGDAAPVSLGVMPDGPRGEITVSEQHRALLPGATLAVSVEPEGGSPTGAPTGDVVAAGQVEEV